MKANKKPLRLDKNYTFQYIHLNVMDCIPVLKASTEVEFCIGPGMAFHNRTVEGKKECKCTVVRDLGRAYGIISIR